MDFQTIFTRWKLVRVKDNCPVCAITCPGRATIICFNRLRNDQFRLHLKCDGTVLVLIRKFQVGINIYDDCKCCKTTAFERNTIILGQQITIDAGGSGEGLTQVSDGTVDIGNSDVEASEKLDEAQAAELVDHQVCVITMAAIVNPDVAEAGVTDLSKEELIGIFTGEITNWSEVGGPDEDIVLVTRPTSSGTRATFQKYALDGNEEASNASMETDDSGVLLQNVRDTKGAIGYVALSYLVDDPGVATVAIDGVEPTLENTYNGTYPVWTFEHMYTKGEPNEVVGAFLDYIMSDEYGTRMEELGYGVSSKMTTTEH